MKKQTIKETAAEIVKDVVRRGEVRQTAGVLELLPSVVESVVVDREYIRQCISRGPSKNNPINALLGLIGLRLVSTDSPVWMVEKGSSGPVDASLMNDFLKIDSDRLSPAATEISGVLAAAESDNRKELQSGQEHASRVHGELDRINQKYNQLSVDFENQRKAVAERTQYILSQCGDGAESTLAEQVSELLDDLEIQVYWSAEGAPLSAGAMFSTMKCAPGTKRHDKPCLLCGDTVLAKGLKFVPSDEPEQ